MPVATIVEFPVEVFGAAEKRTGVLEPAAMSKGLVGFEMTPAGKPVRVTCDGAGETVERVDGKHHRGTSRALLEIHENSWKTQWRNQVAQEEVEVEAASERWRNRRRSRQMRVEKDRITNPGRIVWAVPLRSPTFLAGSRLKETCRGEKAARAGTRGVERVTENNFNPIVLIVKLRNIRVRGRKRRKNRRAARTECPRRPEEN